MNNQIELNKFYLIYDGGPTIIYPLEYYGKYSNRVRYRMWCLYPFVWDLVGIEENNYVDINSEESITENFIWRCPFRLRKHFLFIRQLNRKLFSSDIIMIYESHSAVDFVKYIRDNFNPNTVSDLHRHNFEDNFEKRDCDAIQQKN